MPLTSAQIQQLNGSFAQQYLTNQQFAANIAPPNYNLGGYNTGAQNEAVAGKALNVGSAIAAPGAMLGLGLMGLDPLSMGLRGGMAAHAAGAGLGGSLMAGAAVAAPMMAGIAGVGYMSNQVMSGAQQTQQFHQNMREGYTFFNARGQHGRGLADLDVRDIGSSIRGMSSQVSGGQFGGAMSQFELGPSFAEMGRLASSMGRLGLADGVRNAKDFTLKFKEMMTTVTTIAKDLGTTLEEAQKTMAALKGSGIFKGQGAVVSQIRSASVAGNLATTEVTGMMNIGSQISRMFGGTGKQGALGGIRAIEQVGVAREMGALSEEDIYNATGLTGAEGRRAMAQQNMMQTGSFLKSSKGRWMLASLAGKDGNLDAGSVNEFLTGGQGVGDTRGAAHRNLRKVGRANFIRNEGRLRGSVMEEFGGLAPAMAMTGWAQSRGIDINSMGDREMLFMQRQMGLGRDEADSLVKMARKLPALLEKRRESQQEDILSREHGMRAQRTGIEGIKRKLEAAKNSVNNEMQKVGQDTLNYMSDRIASWGNALAGTYEHSAMEGIREVHKTATMGGVAGRAATHQVTGKLSGIKGLGATPGLDVGLPHESIGQRRYLDKVQSMQFSARMATATGMSADLQSQVDLNMPGIRKAYDEQLLGMGGEDRMAGFKQRFKGTDLGARFAKMAPQEQAAFMQSMEGQMGIKTGRLSETFQVPGLPELVGGGKHRTVAERQEAAGRALLGTVSTRTNVNAAADELQKSGLHGTLPYSGGADVVSGMRMFASLFGGAADEIGGSSKQARAAGAVFDDRVLREAAFSSVLGEEGSEGKLQSAIGSLTGLAAERGGFEKLSEEEKGRLSGLRAIQTHSELSRIANAKGGLQGMTDKDWKALIDKKKAQAKAEGRSTDITKESILRSAGAVQELAKAKQVELRSHIAEQVGRTTTQEMQALQAGGIAKLEFRGSGGHAELKLTAESETSLRKGGGEEAVQAARLALSVQDVGLRMGEATSDEERAKLYEQYAGEAGGLRERMAGMSIKSLKAFGRRMAGTEAGGLATEMIMRGQSIDAGSRKRGGAAGAIAAQLGVQFGVDELSGLKGASAQEAAAAIAMRAGVGGDTQFISSLRESIAAAGKKGGGVQAGYLLEQAKAGASEDTRKKLEERNRGEQSPEEKIVEKIGEGNRYLEALVKSNEQAKTQLDALNGNIIKMTDPEKSPGK